MRARPGIGRSPNCAGKIVAALDRQHPRDLFDVRDLLANEGINDDLRKAFIVYVLSHNRPMAEVLSPAASTRSVASGERCAATLVLSVIQESALIIGNFFNF
jgi:hypothetical protein